MMSPDDPHPDSRRPYPPSTGQRLTALAARGLIRLLGATLRYRVEGTVHLDEARSRGPEGRVVFAFWHGRQFPLVYHWRDRDVAILTSLSRDGTLQGMVLGGLGYHIVRGSSSRGAVRGLVGMIRAVRDGRDAAFAVDGPRGPAGEVKPGILYLAARTGLPVLPITSAARNARVFEDAWDRYLLPLPFTRTAVVYGDPIQVPLGTDESVMEQMRGELARRLVRVTRRAEELVGGGHFRRS
ncbi:MAG: lysophospholipid acyltransferase family protein [bacterium]